VRVGAAEMAAPASRHAAAMTITCFTSASFMGH
jgi:hypothetical protein